MSDETRMAESLRAVLDKHIPHEFIEGNDVDQIAAVAVDLDVEFTPVLRYGFHDDPASNYFGSDLPKPVRVVKDGLRYCLMDGKDFQWVSVETLKVMRARYLLFRGFLFKRMHVLPYSQQRQASAWYAIHWTPAEGTPLANLMGMHGESAAPL